MIPTEKSDAVSRGLREAFGVTAMDSIQAITTGLSSDLVFRIVVSGAPFLLRILTRLDQQNDPARVFPCMTAAADAGVAPRVRYASVEDGVAILDWIEAVPFSPTEALAELPPVLRTLHALPRFPKTFNYETAHRYFIWRLRGAGLLPDDEVDLVFGRYLQLGAAYGRREDDMVSCHMDLKPENLLFDGRRAWLIDWQAAHVNDRYFDLAVVANFLARSEGEERTLLERYFGHPAGEWARARFHLMRQVVHMLSAAVFLMLGSAGKGVEPGVEPPPFREFHDRVWAGGVDLADHKVQVTYGLVHWRRLLENVREPRFDEALAIVAGESSGPRFLPPAP